MTAVAAQPRASVDVISERASLAPIEDVWRSLAEERGNAFVTPEWFAAWCEFYDDRAAPRVVVVRYDDEVVGVVPLVSTLEHGFPVVRFGGWNLGDVFHPAARLADEEDVASAAWTALGRRTLGILDNALGDWPDAIAPVWARTRATGDAVPRIDLRSGWSPTRLSRNLRSQLGRKLRALEREHSVALRRAETLADLETDMASLFALHDLRWQERGGSSLASEPARATLHAFSRAALHRGWLRLWTLDVDGTPAASLLAWRLGSTCAYYTAGFDPTYGRHSVGLLLLARTIEEAASEGATAYDLLRGAEAYKLRFATDVDHVRTVVVAPRLHPLSVAAATTSVARRTLDRLPVRSRALLRRTLEPVAWMAPTARRR